MMNWMYFKKKKAQEDKDHELGMQISEYHFIWNSQQCNWEQGWYTARVTKARTRHKEGKESEKDKEKAKERSVVEIEDPAYWEAHRFRSNRFSKSKGR